MRIVFIANFQTIYFWIRKKRIKTHPQTRILFVVLEKYKHVFHVEEGNHGSPKFHIFVALRNDYILVISPEPIYAIH